jgi:hypothetical protein
MNVTNKLSRELELLPMLPSTTVLLVSFIVSLVDTAIYFLVLTELVSFYTWQRGNQTFGERLRVITGNTMLSDDEFLNDNFFLDINNLFGNFNIGNNTNNAIYSSTMLIYMSSLLFDSIVMILSTVYLN